MMLRLLLPLGLLLAGCHIRGDQPAVAASAPAAASAQTNDAEAVALRDQIIVRRKAGTASGPDCYACALEAGKKGARSIDAILREYYASRGIDISGDPAEVALQLHPDQDGSRILKTSTDDGKIVYDICVGSGMLSGYEARLTMVWRDGLYIPISDAAIAVY